MGTFTRRVVVITGASSGIGRATAERFADRGADVVLAARSESSLAEVADACRERGAHAVVVPTDVRDDDQVQLLADVAMATFGRIDVWVGAAAVFSYGRFDETPAHLFRAVVETDLFGQVAGARAVLPVFRAQRHGTLILVGSLFAEVPAAYVSPYVTSKSALRGFAASLRQELLDLRHVHVCVITPSTIDTPIYQHAANRTGRRVHPLPPAGAASRVATAIGRRARRPAAETPVGRLQRVAIPVTTIAPRTGARIVRTVMGRLALRRGAVPLHDGTVLAPDPSSNAIDGGWRSNGLRALVVAGVLLGAVTAAVASRSR